jgi:hypothetical protein
MTKHIAGLILFTFIVGTSAVVAGLFYEAPSKTRSFSIRKDYRSYKRKRRKRRCRKHRKPRIVERGLAGAELKQALFDQSTGLLTASHGSGTALNDGRRGTLVYHFYVKDEFGTRHIRSERVWGAFEGSKVISDFEWLSNRNSNENLYVASEYKDFRSFWKIAPKFDESNAVPVLIKGK